MSLPAWRGSAFNQPACLTPACLITKIFVLTGDTGSRSWGRRHAGWSVQTQEPEGQRGWGNQSRGDKQGRSRVDAPQGRGIEEEDSGNSDNDGTGEREKKGGGVPVG